MLDLLHKDAGVGAISQAENGAIAVEMIRAQRPDILFLDVQMPELDGLGVIGAIGAEDMPLTVFVTAYDEHAIRAFEANALDYLLKPFSDERFEATMARSKRDWMSAGCGNSAARTGDGVARADGSSGWIDWW